jgi:hypothetical protein
MNYPRFGILGHDGEYKPRFGLWLDTSPECSAAVKGILAEGFDCDLVLKPGFQCERHWTKTRPIVSLSYYDEWKERTNGCLDLFDCSAEPGCYFREVYFPEKLNLRRRLRAR